MSTPHDCNSKGALPLSEVVWKRPSCLSWTWGRRAQLAARWVFEKKKHWWCRALQPFSVSTAPPNALILMEHRLHFSLPGSGHPKHGGRWQFYCACVGHSSSSCGSASGIVWWREQWEKSWELQRAEGAQVPQQGASAAPEEPMLGQVLEQDMPWRKCSLWAGSILVQVCPEGLWLMESPHWTLGKVCRERSEMTKLFIPKIPLHCSEELGMKEWS